MEHLVEVITPLKRMFSILLQINFSCQMSVFIERGESILKTSKEKRIR